MWIAISNISSTSLDEISSNLPKHRSDRYSKCHITIETKISYKVGNELPSEKFLLSQEDIDKELRGITDHLDYYKGKSPWGSSIFSPTTMFGVMALGSDKLDTERDKAVPFFGATEIRNVNGPALVGVPYEVTGKIVCVGVSRKTEYYWHDSILKEKESGSLFATMRHLNRFMKAGSPLYEDSK